MDNSQAATDNRKFYFGLEYLRIIFILLIIGWHTKILGQVSFYIYPTHIDSRNFLYFCFFLSGVPIFFIISQYLYIKNRHKGYLVKRLSLLVIFSVFWNLVAFVLFADQSSIQNWTSFNFIVKGGYGPLYFIFDLIIITLVSELICLCHERSKTKNFVLIIYLFLCLILAFAAVIPFVVKPGNFISDYLLSFQNFLNFLPYGIVAFLISIKENRDGANYVGRPKFSILKFTIALTFGVCISFFEYFIINKYLPLQYFEQLFPFYNRISLFVITLTIFYLFLGFNKPINKHLARLANLTGGVFIIHYLLINILQARFPSWFVYHTIHPILFFLIILIFSYIFSWILKLKRVD